MSTDDKRSTPAIRPWATDDNIALFTDLYELTMLRAYFEAGMTERAVFSLFVRKLPARRNYLLACGLEDVLAYLERLHVTDDAIAYLRSLGHFPEPFLAWLRGLRFEGDVRAVPEGTPVFENEPLLEIEAPIAQAQLVETFVMNQVQLQTILASKAARVVTAAQGRAVVDFGPRRMHGVDAAIKAARAFVIAGLAGTSNVLAGRIYGIPIMGTMAHSFVQACGNDLEAFRAFAGVFPETVLLVDTYDTLEGVRRVTQLARELGDDFRVRAIRLDSGDLGALAREARLILDAAGLERVGIFASGGLDEDKVDALVRSGAPIDGFGVGTAMGVSDDAPSLDIAYKLVAYAGEGRIKLSRGKATLPGHKQVFRTERDGIAAGDTIAAADERLAGRPLLQKVMENGRRVEAGAVDLGKIREHARAETARLPDAVRALAPAEPRYPVGISEELQARTDRVRASLSAAHGDA